MNPNQPGGLRKPGPDSSRLNRTILLLNVGVLVVNFALALKSTDSQIGLLRSTAEASNARTTRPGAAMEPAMLPCARVLQAVEGAAPGTLTPEKVQAILDAVRGYQLAMEEGVGALAFRDRGEDLRATYAQLGKAAREQVEMTLATRFSDPGQAARLATEVIKACQ